MHVKYTEYAELSGDPPPSPTTVTSRLISRPPLQTADTSVPTCISAVICRTDDVLSVRPYAAILAQIYGAASGPHARLPLVIISVAAGSGLGMAILFTGITLHRSSLSGRRPSVTARYMSAAVGAARSTHIPAAAAAAAMRGDAGQHIYPHLVSHLARTVLLRRASCGALHGVRRQLYQ